MKHLHPSQTPEQSRVTCFINQLTHRTTVINQRQLSHYSNGFRHPSKATKEKISSAIARFAADLSDIKLI